MISCILKVHENVDELYKIFSSEKLKSDRAECVITKDNALIFEVKANDPVSMKAFLNSILKIIQIHDKISQIE